MGGISLALQSSWGLYARLRKFLTLVMLVPLWLSGCGGGSHPNDLTGMMAPPATRLAAVAPMTLSSTAFANNGHIPDNFSFSYSTQCNGWNWSPPLDFANVPLGAAALALVVQDTDAANTLHWKAWNIPAATTSLPANASPNATFSQSSNDLGSFGYGGPCPPSASAHHYVFTLYALSKTFTAEPTLADLNANSLGTATLTGLRGMTDHLAWSAQPGESFAGNGWYWDPKAGGTGMMVEAQGSSGFVGLFLYDGAGKPVWYVSLGTFSVQASGYHFSGDLRKYTGGQSLGAAWAQPTSVSVGALDISFTGNGISTHAAVTLPGGRVWQTQRFDFNGLTTSNTAAQPEAGWFWNPNEGGRGYAIEVQNGKMFMAMFHYAQDGSPTWNIVQDVIGVNGGVASTGFGQYSAGQTLTGAYQSPAGPISVGTFAAGFSSSCGGTLAIAGSAAISVQKYTFGGLPSGQECRTRGMANMGQPMVTVSLSKPKASVGGTSTLIWSASNATSCTGKDSLSGSLATSGTSVINAIAGGQFKYTVACTGTVGTTEMSATLIVPMPVFKTSYENKNDILLDDPRLPHLPNIPGVTTETGEQDIGERALAFADFLQEGTFSAITATTFYKGIYPGNNPGQWSDSPAKLYLLRKDTTGTWTDVTSQLIKNSNERYICVSPGFIEIADLNNDGKPDAVISCTGPDFTINGVFDDKSRQYAVLSQPDGSYKVVDLGIVPIYAHQVTLADIDGDGKVDILSVDPGHFFTPIVLWGNGDGTFRLDQTRFPADMYQKAIYGIHAIPVNGKLNVVVSGNPTGAQPGGSSPSDYGTKVLQYTNGAFQYVSDFSATIPKVTSTGLVYGLALDAIYKDGYYYFLRVNGDYTGSAIVKTNAVTGASILITEVVRGNNSDTSGILKLDSQNNFISQMGDCGPYALNASDYFHYQCTFAIPLR